jgi:predicted alpha/beta-hydrolase family hydrolase
VRAPLLLFPGAGGDANHSSLVAIERGLAPRLVQRRDFPYRKLGRRAPDRAPVLIQTVVTEVESIAGRRRKSIVIGGRSMGGRMCSMAVADALVPQAKGLVLIAYPLHPPGKPEKLRVEHLPRITVPCLFISGTRDSFGTPNELLAATATIPGTVTHVWIDRKGHDLKGADDAIVDAIRTWLKPGGGLRG